MFYLPDILTYPAYKLARKKIIIFHWKSVLLFPVKEGIWLMSRLKTWSSVLLAQRLNDSVIFSIGYVTTFFFLFFSLFVLFSNLTWYS